MRISDWSSDVCSSDLIVFGGRRASLVPLVFEARDLAHGVLVVASMGSETTAAATGQVGVMRRDPMAMKPFCGYNFADYFGHWLSFDKPGAKLPQVFHVNWFRKGDDDSFDRKSTPLNPRNQFASPIHTSARQ